MSTWKINRCASRLAVMIEEMTKSEKLCWLAGFFDGEGNIHIRKDAKGYVRGEISLSQQNIVPLRIAREIAAEIGIESSILPLHRQCRVHRMNFYGIAGAKVLRELLPYMQHPKQRARAELFIELYPPHLESSSKTWRIGEKMFVYKKWLELQIQEIEQKKLLLEHCSERK